MPNSKRLSPLPLPLSANEIYIFSRMAGARLSLRALFQVVFTTDLVAIARANGLSCLGARGVQVCIVRRYTEPAGNDNPAVNDKPPRSHRFRLEKRRSGKGRCLASSDGWR